MIWKKFRKKNEKEVEIPEPKEKFVKDELMELKEKISGSSFHEAEQKEQSVPYKGSGPAYQPSNHRGTFPAPITPSEPKVQHFPTLELEKSHEPEERKKQDIDHKIEMILTKLELINERLKVIEEKIEKQKF